MDLWAAYLNAIRRHLKRTPVVFDRFHIHTSLSEAIKEVPCHEQRAAHGTMAELFKGTGGCASRHLARFGANRIHVGRNHAGQSPLGAGLRSPSGFRMHDTVRTQSLETAHQLDNAAAAMLVGGHPGFLSPSNPPTPWVRDSK
jgi:metal-dependent amidase/aminoacylase/carboxypeptidase family protein